LINSLYYVGLAATAGLSAYILTEANKWKTIELALLNAGMASTVKNGASDAWSTVKHATGSVSDLVKSG